MSLRQLSLEFGLIKDYPETIIDYQGDGEIGVVIIFEARFGGASNIRINNVTRNEFIIIDDIKLKAITGNGVIKGDEIQIDTTRGQKTAKLIRDGETISILNAIDLSSKWIQLQKGPNRFTCTAKDDLDNLIVTVNFDNRFLGV